MSIERKVNRVSMVSDASSNGEVLIQGDEAVVRNYDEQALYEQRAIDAQEKAEQEELKRLMSQYEEAALDKNVKLMSPTRMVLRRFFRSKLVLLVL